MEINYSQIEGKSRGFRNILIVIGIVAAVFVFSYLTAYLKGFQVWGINNTVTWGQLITLDIYFIGLSAGAIVVSSLGYVFKKEEYKPIGRLAVFVGLLMMIGAMLCVLTDLGRPEKFWRLFMFFYLNNMTSAFAINGILYGGYILLMIAYLWLVMEGKHHLATLIGTIDVCWAVLVHTFTGSIFGLISTRDILTSPLKPFEFVVAASSSGTALLMLIAFISFKFAKREISPKIFPALGKLLSYFIIVLAIMIFFDKFIHGYFPHRAGVLFLFTGPYWYLFWIFQVGMGIVFPIIILMHPKTNKSVKWLLIAATSVVIGVLGERAAIVIPGLSMVQPLYPGEIQGVWGAYGAFPITFFETTMSVGVIALVGLLFILGLKYLPILPAQPASAPAPKAAPAVPAQPTATAEAKPATETK